MLQILLVYVNSNINIIYLHKKMKIIKKNIIYNIEVEFNIIKIKMNILI